MPPYAARTFNSSSTRAVLGRIRAGRTPTELRQTQPLQLPSEWTLQTLRVLLVYGERSHQSVADPFNLAMRLLLAELDVPELKYESFAPSRGKYELSLVLKPTS